SIISLRCEECGLRCVIGKKLDHPRRPPAPTLFSSFFSLSLSLSPSLPSLFASVLSFFPKGGVARGGGGREEEEGGGGDGEGEERDGVGVGVGAEGTAGKGEGEGREG